MAEQARTAAIQEAYIQGIPTRSVDDLVKALGMDGISKSQVSRLCEDIDERVTAFLERPIAGDWPYLWIDATGGVRVGRGSESARGGRLAIDLNSGASSGDGRAGGSSSALGTTGSGRGGRVSGSFPVPKKN